LSHNLEIEEYEMTIEYSDLCLKELPQSWIAHYSKGFSLSTLKINDSITHFHLHRAVNLLDGDTISHRVDVLNMLALYFLRIKAWDSASYYLHYSLDTLGFSVEDEYDIIYKLGVCYHEMADYNRAIYYLSQQRIRENYYNSLYTMARSYEYLEEYDLAIENYSKIIRARDRDKKVFAVLHRGFCYYHLGNYKDAIRDLEASISGPYYYLPEAYYYLVLSYDSLGKLNKACRVLEKGLSQSEDREDVKAKYFERLSGVKLNCP